MFKCGTKPLRSGVPVIDAQVADDRTDGVDLGFQSPGVASFTRAAIGRWSLAVLGSDHELSGSAPLTMIWSIRARGNAAGQLKPNPSPAAPWVERIWEVT